MRRCVKCGSFVESEEGLCVPCQIDEDSEDKQITLMTRELLAEAKASNIWIPIDFN